MDLEERYKKETGYSVGKIHDTGMHYCSNDYVEWLESLVDSDSISDVRICLTKEEESKQIEAISSIIKGLAKDNSTVAIGSATMRILNAFTRSINRC